MRTYKHIRGINSENFEENLKQELIYEVSGRLEDYLCENPDYFDCPWAYDAEGEREMQGYKWVNC